MKQKEFDGDLKGISPDKIIKESATNRDNKLGSFFLGLGIIFNDLKDLILIEELIVENYKKPKKGNCSDHLGNYNGIVIHINKLFASIINEFFVFIEKHVDVIELDEFKDILQRLPREEQAVWNGIVDSATGKNSKMQGFLKTLLRIRSNIAFHYDHSGKVLKKGFISRFFGEEKNIYNEKAYYSIVEENLKHSRFYFSDAAVEEALFLEAGKKEKKKIEDDKFIEEYRIKMFESINIIGKLILLLLKNFLQTRRNLH